MNKALRNLTGLLLLALTLTPVFAQSQKDRFPTYEQIRGNKEETVDYVHPNGGSWTVVRRKMPASRYLDAFSYPDKAALYFLNGRKMKNKKSAEKELRENGGTVESVSIGPVESNGKRIIRIDYEVVKD